MGHVLYNRVVSRPDKGLLILYFSWCPTLQNHTITGYATLFTGFERTPISCGFTGSAYGAICHLVAAKTAIQTIKNPLPEGRGSKPGESVSRSHRASGPYDGRA